MKVGAMRLVQWRGAIEPQRVADDDRPGPDAGEDEARHHHFDDDVGLEEQLDRIEVARRAGRGFGRSLRGGGEEGQKAHAVPSGAMLAKAARQAWG